MTIHQKWWDRLTPERKTELALEVITRLTDKRPMSQCSSTDPGPMSIEQIMFSERYHDLRQTQET